MACPTHCPAGRRSPCKCLWEGATGTEWSRSRKRGIGGEHEPGIKGEEEGIKETKNEEETSAHGPHHPQPHPYSILVSKMHSTHVIFNPYSNTWRDSPVHRS